MPLSLAEYVDSLRDRNLLWPKVLAPKPVKAKPKLTPLPDIKVVLWDVYGTLLRTPDDKGFDLDPNPELRLQVALDKTIHEYNMWNSMYRKPGAPWQSMIGQYRDYCQNFIMAAPRRRGDFTHPDLVAVWAEIIGRLFEKEYTYDEDTFGDLSQYAEKVAWFFHSNLQALEVRSGVLDTISVLREMGIQQNLLGDAQPFTLFQLTKSLAEEGLNQPIAALFPPDQAALSFRVAVRKPSVSLFEYAVASQRENGFEPHEILHVSCRMTDDLVPAKKAGMRTALLAAEKIGLEAPADLIKDPQSRPDRLLTDLAQITSIVTGAA